jgi:hypothetical protein
VALQACCPGDTEGDDDYDLDDLAALKGKLFAGWIATSQGAFKVVKGDPNTGHLWDPCYDYDDDGSEINLDDLAGLKGKLFAGWIATNQGAFKVEKGDPNTGPLWPCP